MKVTDYNSVMAYGVEELEVEVKEAILEGWQPHGGPYVFKDKLFQALVKYEDESTQAPSGQNQYEHQAELDRRVQERLKDYEQYWDEEGERYYIPDPQFPHDSHETWTPTKDELIQDIESEVRLDLNSEQKS